MSRKIRNKVCKAKKSIKTREVCNKTFKTNPSGPLKKFCSESCRKRHNRIKKALEDRKEKKRQEKEKKILEYRISLRGKVQLILNKIDEYQNEIIRYENRKRPKIKKSMDYRQKMMIEDLQYEFDIEQEKIKIELPHWRNILTSETRKLSELLKYSYTTASKKDKKEVKNMITEFMYEIFYQEKMRNVFNQLVSYLKDWVFTEDELSDFDLLRLFNK